MSASAASRRWCSRSPRCCGRRRSANFPSLWQYLQTILAYTAPPVAALYVLGLFWPRPNAAGARAAIIAGLVVGAALFAAGPVAGAVDIHFLYVALLLFAVAALAHVAGSLTGTAPSAEKLVGLLWSREFYRAETAALAAVPWWRNYRVLAAGLLAITFALVAAFA